MVELIVTVVVFMSTGKSVIHKKGDGGETIKYNQDCMIWQLYNTIAISMLPTSTCFDWYENYSITKALYTSIHIRPRYRS